MAEDDRGEPLYINTEAMLANRVGLEASGIAMTLVFEVWWPTKEPFAYDEAALAERLARTTPDATEEMLRRNRAAVATYFTELPDGRWVPSPEFFSLTDGNPGGRVV